MIIPSGVSEPCNPPLHWSTAPPPSNLVAKALNDPCFQRETPDLTGAKKNERFNSMDVKAQELDTSTRDTISPLPTSTTGMLPSNATFLLEDDDDRMTMKSRSEKKPRTPITLEAQTLSHGRRRLRSIFTSVAMVTVTIPLFAYIGFAFYLNGKSVDGYTKYDHFQSLSKRLATIFPILFAIVVGWSIRKFAAWNLERGMTLELIERLMGSQAVGMTIATQISIGVLNVPAIILLIIWILSPLGSQSSLELLSIRNKTTSTQFQMAYFNTDSTPGFTQPDKDIVALNTLFMYSLMSDNQKSNDPWGNVLIPDVKSNTVLTEKNTNFSSTIGIRLWPELIENSNYTLSENTSFPIESSYINLNCSKSLVSAEGVEFNSLDQDDIAPDVDNGTLSPNEFYGVPNPNGTFSFSISGFLPGEYGNVQQYVDDTTPHDPFTLLFQSKIPDGSVASLFCDLSTVYTTSNIYCSHNDCCVNSYAPSTLPHPNTNLTNLNFLAGFRSFTSHIMTASNAINGSSALELYLQSPLDAVFAGVDTADISTIFPEELSLPLQQVINTYWYGSYDPLAFMKSRLSVSNISSTGPNPTGQEIRDGMVFSAPQTSRSTTAVSISTVQVYTVRAWAATLFFLSTFMLFFAAIAGAYFSFVVKGPEVLSHVSSLIKDNRFMDSVGDSAIGGFERVRKYGANRVRMVDMETEGNVGYIALADGGNNLNMGGVVGWLREGRGYR
ncbi:hypothetical protein B7494_g5070 [Chlorociboria aeruginascens]|nr:hypothetical protein B7494_g5070 [Chlorociboria aeruginascens]